MKDNNLDNLVEGIDYLIERDYEPSGAPCAICGNPTEVDHAGKLFCPYCIAAVHDKYAKQNSTVTMRLSDQLLADIKQTAKRQGIRHYQEFIRQVLIEAVRKNRNQKKAS